MHTPRNREVALGGMTQSRIGFGFHVSSGQPVIGALVPVIIEIALAGVSQ